jgi:hypothetical protein
LQSTVGIDGTYPSKLKKAAGYPGLDIIAKPATVLEVEPAELLRGVSPAQFPQRRQNRDRAPVT